MTWQFGENQEKTEDKDYRGTENTETLRTQRGAEKARGAARCETAPTNQNCKAGWKPFDKLRTGRRYRDERGGSAGVVVGWGWWTKSDVTSTTPGATCSGGRIK